MISLLPTKRWVRDRLAGNVWDELGQPAQLNRFELKYIISPEKVAHIRDFIRSHLQLDRFARADLNHSYQIHSLYLDSPDLALCRATMHGHKNRFKLRIRFYDEEPHHPVFFEIKGRMNDIIRKERVMVHRSSVLPLLNHKWPERSDLFRDEPKSFATLERFCALKDMLQGEGRLFVSYLREAWVDARDDQLRVTFDHQLQASNYDRLLQLLKIETWYQPRVEGVVLELKFSDRFPFWMQDLVQEFNLQRTVMAKYVACMESRQLLGPRMVSQHIEAWR